MFNWRRYLFTSRCQLSKWHALSPHIRLSCRQEGHSFPLAPRMRTRSLDVQFSLDIFNYHECLGYPIRGLRSYLFVYSTSIFYEPFNFVTQGVMAMRENSTILKSLEVEPPLHILNTQLLFPYSSQVSDYFSKSAALKFTFFPKYLPYKAGLSVIKKKLCCAMLQV